MTNQASLLCSPHNATFGMLQVFSIHMNAAIPNPHPFLEFSIDQDVLDPFTKDFFIPQVEVDDGKVRVPEDPGWGISINNDWLEGSVYTLSEINS